MDTVWETKKKKKNDQTFLALQLLLILSLQLVIGIDTFFLRQDPLRSSQSRRRFVSLLRFFFFKTLIVKERRMRFNGGY